MCDDELTSCSENENPMPKRRRSHQKGKRGFQGLNGPQGEAMTGPQGSTGDKGDQGLSGPQGKEGIMGENGDSGAQGSIGFQGIDGVKGEMGDQGPQGNKGENGDSGVQGGVGFQGIDGAKGKIGDQGLSVVGPQGNEGMKGENGDSGVQGGIGFQGSYPFEKSYSYIRMESGTNAVVSTNGGTFGVYVPVSSQWLPGFHNNFEMYNSNHGCVRYIGSVPQLFNIRVGGTFRVVDVDTSVDLVVAQYFNEISPQEYTRLTVDDKHYVQGLTEAPHVLQYGDRVEMRLVKEGAEFVDCLVLGAFMSIMQVN